MKIKFFGHAAFIITSASGVKIITDPYKPGCFDGGIKYEAIDEAADIVTISHDHDDHNETDIPGNPEFVRGIEERDIKGVLIHGLEVFHDTSGGRDRGKNVIYSMKIDGLNVVHCGDLGHVLDAEEVEKIGKVDVLLLPVGGHFTIDAATSDTVVQALKPRVVIPMHFKTDKCGFPIAPIDTYIASRDVQRVEGEFEISRETLPESTTIIVLNPSK
jgi:L-ascorbate metabolism protein UlaG (beta-lactamase superfamily)